MDKPLFPGGRVAALQALANINPELYTRSRNFLAGAVSRLSPYLRHGVLSLAEVRDHALDTVKRPEHAEKFINELAWRDYWQRLYFVVGEGIWQDREAYKTGYGAADYRDKLPAELLESRTGLNCMDSFSRDLQQIGYLHNHARMWMSAYLIHWLRVRWQTGARWFLEHLLDGDPASNNLSWQWVASTFSSKPYFFNRENLERYTDGIYCRTCLLKHSCPLQGSYEALEMQLFPVLGQASSNAPDVQPGPPLRQSAPIPAPRTQPRKPLLWIHTDSLNPASELLARNPGAPMVFLWDEPWLREAAISPKRVAFLEQCVAEFPAALERRTGHPSAQLLEAAKAAKASGCDAILAQRTPDPHLLAAASAVQSTLPVLWIDPPRFVDDGRGFELKRFSRYWQRAQTSAMRHG